MGSGALEALIPKCILVGNLIPGVARHGSKYFPVPVVSTLTYDTSASAMKE